MINDSFLHRRLQKQESRKVVRATVTHQEVIAVKAIPNNSVDEPRLLQRQTKRLNEPSAPSMDSNLSDSSLKLLVNP